MHRFLIAPTDRESAQLSPEESHHALRVLRLAEGAIVQLSDGAGALYQGSIARIEDGSVRVNIGDPIDGTEAPISITLYQGLPKFDKLELVCQKATELGIARIVPVKTSRAVVKLNDADGLKKQARMQKICAEAAKQCGRAIVPLVEAPMPFKQALEMMRGEGLMLMPWEEARDVRMSDLRNEYLGASSIGIFIGPEGGIAPEEATAAESVGAKPITLGPRILRTETAAIAAMAMAMQLWGDL